MRRDMRRANQFRLSVGSDNAQYLRASRSRFTNTTPTTSRCHLVRPSTHRSISKTGRKRRNTVYDRIDPPLAREIAHASPICSFTATRSSKLFPKRSLRLRVRSCVTIRYSQNDPLRSIYRRDISNASQCCWNRDIDIGSNELSAL